MCVVAYKMTSTNMSGLFVCVGEFDVARETFSAYVERMEMFFTANNIVEITGEGSAAANQVVANRKRAINGKPCMMELDTAPSQVTLKTYTGEVLEVLGEMYCDIVYKGKQYSLPILVADYDAKPTLLGKNWLRHIKLEWGEIFCIPKGDALSADTQLN